MKMGSTEQRVNGRQRMREREIGRQEVRKRRDERISALRQEFIEASAVERRLARELTVVATSRARIVKALRLEGVPVNQVAELLGISERDVRSLRMQVVSTAIGDAAK